MTEISTDMDQFWWPEKYRPKTIEECILPSKIKNHLLAFKDQGNLPNMIFAGPPGVGKTTVAKAFCQELGINYMFLQGSGKDRGIDTIRTKMEKFATSVSWDDSNQRKIIIIDEGDHLTPDSMLALRSFIETNADNCGFIFTANYPGRFLDALISRLHVVDFKIPRGEGTRLAVQFLRRIVWILKAEGITDFSEEVLKTLVQKYFPDMRRILNALQTYSSTGKIDEGVLDLIRKADSSELVRIMGEREWNQMRKWVGENVDDPAEVILDLYQNGPKYFKTETFPQAILHLNDCQNELALAIDKQISLVACLTRLMQDCEFNDV